MNTKTKYDVIVVGARVAGSATAMLLARRGLRVLVVDRASFPSDTLSTHQVHMPGVARLREWGLLDTVVAQGTPLTRRIRFDQNWVVLDGHLPGEMFSPRRTVLDKVLVDAARAAGAEVRERYAVEEIVVRDGRVTGIRGRDHGFEAAPLVVGADGKHSLVARTVQAPTYRARPAMTFAYYAYWDGVELDGAEMYGGRGTRGVGAFPTTDGLTVTYIGGPASEFNEFRRDPEGNVLAALDRAGDLGERVRSGRRAEPIRGTADVPNFFRKPYGPGWALVGDAGLVIDPITGQGISHAFRDAELLADAIVTGRFRRYEQRRNRDARPIYDLTAQLASFGPPAIEHRVLFEALAGNQAETDRFLGVLFGGIPMREYFSPGNLRRVIGVRGMARIAASKLRTQQEAHHDLHADRPQVEAG